MYVCMYCGFQQVLFDFHVVLFCFFQQDLVTCSRLHHNEKGIRHFKGNIETFVRIILDSGLSEIFCLQNL